MNQKHNSQITVLITPILPDCFMDVTNLASAYLGLDPLHIHKIQNTRKRPELLALCLLRSLKIGLTDLLRGKGLVIPEPFLIKQHETYFFVMLVYLLYTNIFMTISALSYTKA
jgi:hypothetical protein